MIITRYVLEKIITNICFDNNEYKDNVRELGITDIFMSWMAKGDGIEESDIRFCDVLQLNGRARYE